MRIAFKRGSTISDFRYCQTTSGRQPDIEDFWPHHERRGLSNDDKKRALSHGTTLSSHQEWDTPKERPQKSSISGVEANRRFADRWKSLISKMRTNRYAIR
jgi:hypothetical protein